MRAVLIHLRLLILQLQRIFHTQRVQRIFDCETENGQPSCREGEGGREELCESLTFGCWSSLFQRVFHTQRVERIFHSETKDGQPSGIAKE